MNSVATADREGLDNELPKAVLTRLVKNVLPEGTGISKDAKTAFGMAAQIFVAYATATANELALADNRKTISATDVLKAMEAMDFTEFIEPLQADLVAFQRDAKDKRREQNKRREEMRRAAREAAAAGAEGDPAMAVPAEATFVPAAFASEATPFAEVDASPVAVEAEVGEKRKLDDDAMEEDQPAEKVAKADSEESAAAPTE